MEDESEEEVEVFGAAKENYNWINHERRKKTLTSSEPGHTMKSFSLTNSPHTEARHVTSYSETNSPATRSRLNLSSNSNPFLIEDDGDEDSEELQLLRSIDPFQHHKNVSNRDKSRKNLNNGCSNAGNSSNDQRERENNSEESNNRGSIKMASRSHQMIRNTQNRQQNSEESETSGAVKPQPAVRPFKNRLNDTEKRLDAQLQSTLKRADHKTPYGGTSYGTEYQGSKVFGKNFKYMKGYIQNVAQSCDEKNQSVEKALQGERNVSSINGHVSLSCDEGRTPHGWTFCLKPDENTKDREFCLNPDENTKDREICTGDSSYKKYFKLQQELKSSLRKVQKLKEVNALALQRKDELQREVLDAYKTISNLEISDNSSKNKHRELSLEVRLAKQRVAEAEREASHAIGHASKLERNLIDTEENRKKYYDDLHAAEARINVLEKDMRQIRSEWQDDHKSINSLKEQLKISETELAAFRGENQNLHDSIVKKEEQCNVLALQLQQMSQDQAKRDEQIEELTKANATLKDELQRLQTKYEISQRTVDQCTGRVQEQKNRFDILITSRLEIEKELRDTRDELSKERVEKTKHVTKSDDLLNKLNDSKSLLDKSELERNELQKENRTLKDRLLYLDLYAQMVDSKSKSTVHENSKSISTTAKKGLPAKASSSVSDKTNQTKQVQPTIENISKKLQALKQEHDLLHEEIEQKSPKPVMDQSFSTNKLFDQSLKRNKFFDQSITRNLNENNETYSFNAQNSLSVLTPDMEDSFYDFDPKDGDSLHSTPDLIIDAPEDDAIFPSFVSSMQQGGSDNNTKFSDLMQAKGSSAVEALF